MSTEYKAKAVEKAWPLQGAKYIRYRPPVGPERSLQPGLGGTGSHLNS